MRPRGRRPERLYGLGCSMYHLMTGKLPFPGDRPLSGWASGSAAGIADHRVSPGPAPSFVRVLDKMLAHKPHERYATAAEAATALRA